MAEGGLQSCGSVETVRLFSFLRPHGIGLGALVVADRVGYVKLYLYARPRIFLGGSLWYPHFFVPSNLTAE